MKEKTIKERIKDIIDSSSEVVEKINKLIDEESTRKANEALQEINDKLTTNVKH